MTNQERNQIKLADPKFELRWLDTGAPVSENPTFYHRINADAEARYLRRITGRVVYIVPFISWERLAADRVAVETLKELAR